MRPCYFFFGGGKGRSISCMWIAYEVAGRVKAAIVKQALQQRVIVEDCNLGGGGGLVQLPL